MVITDGWQHCIFNQKINDGIVFKVGDDHIEVVNEYKYLGFIFNTHLKDPLGTVSDQLLRQAQKATYQARKLSGAVLGRLSPKLAFKVFDTQILPIMEYGSEIWYKVKAPDKHEKFHLSYIKSTLGVRPQTTTDAVMSDTGRFPLQLRKNVNVIKYWLRLAKLGNEDPVHNAFNTLVQLHNFGQKNWWTEVSTLMELLKIDEPDILTTAPEDKKKQNCSQYKR